MKVSYSVTGLPLAEPIETEAYKQGPDRPEKYRDYREYGQSGLLNKKRWFRVSSCVRAVHDGLKLQSFSHSFAKFRVSFGKVSNHAPLNGLVCFSQRINYVINQMVLIHFAE
jgi:hypothetical protein